MGYSEHRSRPIHLRVGNRLLERLDRLAQEQGASRAEMARRALGEGVDLIEERSAEHQRRVEGLHVQTDDPHERRTQ